MYIIMLEAERVLSIIAAKTLVIYEPSNKSCVQLFQKQIFLVADTAAGWYQPDTLMPIWRIGYFALAISNAPVCPKTHSRCHPHFLHQQRGIWNDQLLLPGS